MKKIALLIILTLMTPASLANITLTSSYNVVDAAVDSTLFGSDSDHQEGEIPVEALAEVGGNLGYAGAYASANLLSAYTYAYVALLPDPEGTQMGVSVSSATDVLFGLTSTTSWELDIETIASAAQSPNGSTSLTGVAFVWDAALIEVYNYDMSVDGPFGSATFGPGSYSLAFGTVSIAAASVEPAGEFESAESSVYMTGALVAIPAPGALSLGYLGVVLVHLLRRGRRFVTA